MRQEDGYVTTWRARERREGVFGLRTWVCVTLLHRHCSCRAARNAGTIIHTRQLQDNNAPTPRPCSLSARTVQRLANVWVNQQQ